MDSVPGICIVHLYLCVILVYISSWGKNTKKQKIQKMGVLGSTAIV